MTTKSKRQFGLIRLVQVGVALAVALWAPGGHAQDTTQTQFDLYALRDPIRIAFMHDKLEARSQPAQLTHEDASLLTSKGYVNIGRVRATQPGTNDSTETRKKLEEAILRKAADSGGDVVRLERESVPGGKLVQTGKMKKICIESTEKTSFSYDPKWGKNCTWNQRRNEPDCYNTLNYELSTKSERSCKKWEEVPETKEVKGRVTEGAVWRRDPQLVAQIAASHPVEGKATVYVYRKRTMWGAVRTPEVYCNDVTLAQTQNGRYFRVQLDPGHYFFRGEGQEYDYLIYFELLPGDVRYVSSQVTYSPHMSHANAAVLQPKSPEEAVLEIRSLKALDADKVVDKARVAGRGEIPDNPPLK